MVSKSKIELCHTVPEENVIDFFPLERYQEEDYKQAFPGHGCSWLLVVYFAARTRPLLSWNQKFGPSKSRNHLDSAPAAIPHFVRIQK